MTRENGARGGVPDLAGSVEDEAETRIVIGGDDTTQTGADDAPTQMTGDAPTLVTLDEAPTHIAMPAPGRPHAGEPGRPSSRTATDILDLATPEDVATVPLVPEPAPPPRSDPRVRDPSRRRARRHAASAAARARIARIGVALALLLVAAVVGLVIASDDRSTEATTPTADEGSARAGARSRASHGPILVGATPASVAPETDDLERRAIDLVAAHRYSEALPLYDDLVAASPSRRELELARDLVRARAEAEGAVP